MMRLFPGAEEAIHTPRCCMAAWKRKNNLGSAVRRGIFAGDLADDRVEHPAAGEGAPAYLDWISELAEYARVGAVMIKIAARVRQILGAALTRRTAAIEAVKCLFAVEIVSLLYVI